MASLAQIFEETLSPYKESRVKAEGVLQEASKQPGHLLAVLQLVGDAGVNDAIRQGAAVHFKNIVKAAWDEAKDAEDRKGIAISGQDRTTIKTNLVELMSTVPPRIQSQVSESISLIAEVDFPQKWDNLLPDLINKFNSPDINVVNGVLRTADSIFKRFRHVERSDGLYAVIIYTLNLIQEPLLMLFVQTSRQVDGLVNVVPQLTPRLESLRLMARIYLSLCFQDLPEYMEDHMSEWMGEFAKFLQYSNPFLVDNDEEQDPGPIDKLQAAIISSLKLFAERDEEPFQPFLPEFTKLVWNLLVGLTTYTKHDQLVVSSIKFLAILVGRKIYGELFREDATLREIVSRIVIPNMMVRESDEENFHDNPEEFIMTELEGSDNESRRRCSRDLLGAMCRQFEAQTTGICSEHITQMMREFSADNSKWISKDTAIHLMVGITIRKESTYGVSELNHNVNLMDFFSTQIIPELQDTNSAKRPMVKATSLNFVCIFRNQFNHAQLISLMPLLMNHLASDVVVIHTLAAYTIERLLWMKEIDPSGVGIEKLSRTDIQPFLQTLFGNLFNIVDNIALNENEYVMKCIMRSLDRAGSDVIPVTGVLFEKLSNALERVCKNPRNPGFNHNLFESIALLVKNCCSADPSKTSELEALLFPPFQGILQLDVAEFSPYVFQILAQLLEYRPTGTGLGEAYTSLFPPLLTAELWDRTGNVPGLIRLLQAYLKRSASELLGHLVSMLGIFQKLLASKVTEQGSMDLLSSLMIYVPQTNMQPYCKEIFHMILIRLNGTKSNRFPLLVVQFFGLFSGLYGGLAYFEILDKIQPGVGKNVLLNVWLRHLLNAASSKVAAKAQIVGLTRILCEGPLLGDDSGKQVWAQALHGVVALLASPTLTKEEKDRSEEVSVAYDATFSQLKYAQKVPGDPFVTVADPLELLLSSLKRLSTSHPGVLVPIIQQGLGSDPKLASAFSVMCESRGIQLA